MDKITIWADERERSAAVAEALSMMETVRLEWRQLKTGDYQVGQWLFERKTLIDFAQSIIDGRLFSQAMRLSSAPQPAAIILEGRARDLGESEMRRECLQGALVSLSLIYQIPVLRSFDPAETARLLVYAGQQLWRVENEHSARRGRRPKRRRKLQLFVLQGLPGVGAQKAERLLDHFGSVEAVMRSGTEELQKVAGIGETIAGAIRSVLQPD
jgi:DNA excision repair protein ERCC-4